MKAISVVPGAQPPQPPRVTLVSLVAENSLPSALTTATTLVEEVADAAKRARDGKLTIGAPTGEAQPEPGEMKVRARRRTFDNDLLERY